MKTEIHYLARLLEETVGLSKEKFAILCRRLPDDMELDEFEEALSTTGICTDTALTRELAQRAIELAQAEAAPPSDPPPLEASRLDESERKIELNKSIKPSASLETVGHAPDWASLTDCDENTLASALASLLEECRRRGASDLHLSAGAPPFMRKTREIEYLGETVLNTELTSRLNTVFLSNEQRTRFEEAGDLDYALKQASGERFRVNLMRHHLGVGGTYRIVSNEIKTLEQLGFDSIEAIESMLAYHNGLILVTGPVGSGKTTTLAALIDWLNQSRQDHIITVEDPVEIVHRSASCQVTQRQTGTHTRTFRSALKGALRQDPDIIAIGEMRDLETIEMAISASETGHLVIGTMHTSDAATTLNRLLDVFPPSQVAQIRAMVAESLRGILCQRLLPARDGGVALASEVLLNNTAVNNLIRENKIEGLSNVIETGSRQGMQLMDKSVMELWRQGKIDDKTALANLQSAHLKREVAGPDEADSEHTQAKKRGFFRS